LGKAQYSINKGLWGTSVGGKETLTSINHSNDAPTITKKEGEESYFNLEKEN
jgi:argininosuccinate synthase